MPTIALFQKIDSIRVPVPDLESGLAFYRDRLGHHLIWRTERGAGLRLLGSDTELVLVPRDVPLEVNFHVASAEAAAERYEQADGIVVVPAFQTRNGVAVVVQDPFGNVYALRDDSLGELVTDEEGHILGTESDEASG
jgi:catechol 2,3-dioxygenase-like lactoylglutathione lyase family enzyme